MVKDVFIHSTAIVDEGAIIGEATKIWHWSHVCSGAVIGKNCSLGQNTYVGNNVLIGSGVKIQNNVSIYDNVTLEDDVFCGPSTVFTNVYNPRAAIPRKNEYRDTYIEKGVTLGANSTIICGIKIQKHAFVAAGAVVRNEVPAFALMVGVPARQIGWMSKFGERIPLAINSKQTWQCPHTKNLYKVSDGIMKFIER